MVPTDFNTTNYQESLVDIIASFIANAKTTILMQPRKRTLDNPTAYPQTTSIAGAPSSQERLNDSSTELPTMRFAVISAIPQHRSRTPERSPHLACNRRDRIDQCQQLGDIVPIRSRQSDGQRNAVGVGYQMVFRPLFAAIRGVGACFRPPKTARTEAESTTAREKSIWSARRNWLSKTRWMLSHTPALCQSRRRRQQVIPEPQPIS